MLDEVGNGVIEGGGIDDMEFHWRWLSPWIDECFFWMIILG